MTRALWVCPECGRTFAAHHQVHTCAPLGDLDAHFAACDASVRETFEAVVAAVRTLGPVEVLPQRTRIALHARMSFAAFQPRRRWLAGHLVLAAVVRSPRFHRLDSYSPGNVVHQFRLAAPAEVDAEFRGWLAAAYAVGRQDPR